MKPRPGVGVIRAAAVDFRCRIFYCGGMSTGRRGFSILEIIVASVIIMVAFVPILTLMNASDRAFKKSDNNAVAHNLAMEALEWARAVPFEALEPAIINGNVDGYRLPVALRAFETDEDPAGLAPKTTLGYPASFFRFFSDFEREMSIEPLGTDNRMKLVTVRVVWVEPGAGGNDAAREEVVKAVVVDTRPF